VDARRSPAGRGRTLNGFSEQEKKLRWDLMQKPFWMDEMLLSLSRPQGGRDEHGRLRPTMPCPRCGRVTPLLDPTAEVMRLRQWCPYEAIAIVNWFGHNLEYIPVPRGDGGCQLVPILGEAT